MGRFGKFAMRGVAALALATSAAAPATAMAESVARTERCSSRAVAIADAFEREAHPLAERIQRARAQAAAASEARDFTAVLAKADALRAAYDVTVLPQAKKLGKQFGTLEAAGYNAVAFADNDDIKVLGQKAE